LSNADVPGPDLNEKDDDESSFPHFRGSSGKVVDYFLIDTIDSEIPWRPRVLCPQFGGPLEILSRATSPTGSINLFLITRNHTHEEVGQRREEPIATVLIEMVEKIITFPAPGCITSRRARGRNLNKSVEDWSIQHDGGGSIMVVSIPTGPFPLFIRVHRRPSAVPAQSSLGVFTLAGLAIWRSPA
jgi:hypothetical protein